MLLTLRATHDPASVLGLLQACDRVESFDLPFGKAHTFFPEADETACTAALLLEVPAVAPLDRAYASSAFLALAISRLFGAAIEEPGASIPLEAKIAAVPCREGEALLRRLFEPLGYKVAVEVQPLDPAFPEWGPSPYLGVTLRAVCPPGRLLRHLAVLIAVLDDGRDVPHEIRELLRHGAGWLDSHPERELISRRLSAAPGR